MLNFHHQAVRDLAWCCCSAPLLQALPDSKAEIWPKNCVDPDIEWLKKLDQEPAPLLALLKELKSTRLGIYYETLWRFYWQHQPDCRLIAHNLQVIQSGRTLGAFDFLLQRDKEYWHVETAVKFYLGIPQTGQTQSDWRQWIGPNCNDRLDIKLERLLTHQLPLSESTAGQKHLATLTGATFRWRQALCLQGYLFYPAHLSMHAPVAGHARHGSGFWWYLRDFLGERRDGNNQSERWMVLTRDRWLSAAQTTDINELLYGKNLLDTVEHWVGSNHRPQLLAVMVKDEGIWREVTRGFVVPDHWPWTA